MLHFGEDTGVQVQCKNSANICQLSHTHSKEMISRRLMKLDHNSYLTAAKHCRVEKAES